MKLDIKRMLKNIARPCAFGLILYLIFMLQQSIYNINNVVILLFEMLLFMLMYTLLILKLYLNKNEKGDFFILFYI